MSFFRESLIKSISGKSVFGGRLFESPEQEQKKKKKKSRLKLS